MSTPASDISNVTNIVLSFPDWVYFALTSGILLIAFTMGMLYTDLRKVIKEQPKIITSLTRVSEILLQKNLTKTPVYVGSSSPVKLTKAGNAALKEAKFSEFYEKNKVFLIKRVNEKKPEDLADLDEACKEVMLSIDDNLPGFNNLRNFAYNNGDPISLILFAGAIALREKLRIELKIDK